MEDTLFLHQSQVSKANNIEGSLSFPEAHIQTLFFSIFCY